MDVTTGCNLTLEGHEGAYLLQEFPQQLAYESKIHIFPAPVFNTVQMDPLYVHQ
jgi:hypothetical protein